MKSKLNGIWFLNKMPPKQKPLNTNHTFSDKLKHKPNNNFSLNSSNVYHTDATKSNLFSKRRSPYLHNNQNESNYTGNFNEKRTTSNHIQRRMGYCQHPHLLTLAVLICNIQKIVTAVIPI